MPFRFDWDENERRENIRKHVVDFIDVIPLFDGPLIEEIDDREDYGEERIAALGHVEGTVYRVVYTMRGDVVLIITARKANKNDQEAYFRALHDG